MPADTGEVGRALPSHPHGHGQADTESVALAFEAGASDYITKPFLGAELRARVASQLSLKRMAEDRRRMDEHLMEREKLSTLGLLVSGVAHDLNNPLGGI